MYRPVTRIAFAGERNNFAEFTGADWKSWQTEAWQSQKSDTLYSKENYQHRIADEGGQGFYLEANRGQFGYSDVRRTWQLIGDPTVIVR